MIFQLLLRKHHTWEKIWLKLPLALQIPLTYKARHPDVSSSCTNLSGVKNEMDPGLRSHLPPLQPEELHQKLLMTHSLIQ